MRIGNGVVFAVAGSKGGVGKTTTSINLSAVFGEEGYDVVLVEVDLAMANVGDFLDIDVGLDGEDPTFHQVLAGTATVVDATYASPCAFDVVPSGASLGGYGDADIGGLREVLATLRFAYDVVVLDTGAGVTVETVVPLALADETVLVSSPRVASVRDTMKTRDLTRQVGGSVAGVVFVRSGTGRSPDVDHIADFLSVDLLGHVPEDSAVPNAQDIGLPVVVADPDSRAAAAYRALGDRLAEHIDALGRPSTGALSTDSLDRDGSGFAFVDRSTEDGGGDERSDANESPDETDGADGADGRAAAAVSRTANEHADGSMLGGKDRATRNETDGSSSTVPTGELTSSAQETSNHEADDSANETSVTEVEEPTDDAGAGGVREPIDDSEGDTAAENGADGSELADHADEADEASETTVAEAMSRAENPDELDEPRETGHADVDLFNETETTSGTNALDEAGASDATETIDDGEVVETAQAAGGSVDRRVAEGAEQFDPTSGAEDAARTEVTGASGEPGGDSADPHGSDDPETTDDTSETDDSASNGSPATADAGAETVNGDEEGVNRSPDGSEPTPSTTKRLIDRAKDLVDRRSD
jgi:septum site-determining protein MinD